jgi:Cytochrome oxidase complex assembly protein 1
VTLTIYFVSVAIMFAFSMPLANFIGFPAWLPLFFIIPFILLRIPCLDIPRILSIGWSPWFLLLFFIPIVNFIIQLLLLFVPPKQTDTCTEQIPPPLPGKRPPAWTVRNWKWFVPLLCLVALVCLGVFVVIFENLMKSSDAYSNAVARAKSNPVVIAALGTQIKDGFFVSGNISENNSWGRANFVIPISGPKGVANLYVSASRSLENWHFNELVVQVDKSQARINLLETNQLPASNH